MHQPSDSFSAAALRPYRPRRWRYGVWGALALLLAACGGGSGSGPVGGPDTPPAPVLRSLNVGLSGDGTVRSQPAGIDCGSTCSASYNDGTEVTLTATPAAGQVFAGWGGDCSGSTSTCRLPMTAARNVTASFNPPPPSNQSLSVSVSGGGSLRSQPAGIDCGSTCTAAFGNGSSVTLTPVPAAGQVFAEWGGACVNAGATCTLSMTESRSASARFAAAPVQTAVLRVTLSGSGTVRSNPLGIDCGSTCQANFESGSSVTLTATPAAGQRFTGWAGACSAAGAEVCTLVLNQAREATANFAAAPVAPRWQAAQLLENSDDFNVTGTNTFADTPVLAALSPTGQALVLWEQSDGQPSGSTRKVFSRLYVPGQGWAAPVQVPGVSTSSSSVTLVEGQLLMDRNGVATWLRPNLETRRYSAAGGWGAAFFSPTQSGGLLSAAAMSAEGAITVLISGSDVYSNTLSPSGTWGRWDRVDASGSLSARTARLALGADGSALAVWRETNPGDTRDSLKAARYTPAGGWQPPQSLESGLDDVPGISPPQVALDAAGNGLAFWHQGNAVYHALFNPRSGWGTPTAVDAGNVNANFAARLTLAMNADGRAVLGWNSGIYAMKVLSYQPGIGFSQPQTVAPYSIDSRLGLDDNGRAVLAYRSPDRWPNPSSGNLNIYSRQLEWGGAWSEAALLETRDGSVKGPLVLDFNRSGQGLAVWAQNDSATTEVRNSLWGALLR